MPNVSTLIKTIQDIMRKDAGVNGDAQRLELEAELSDGRLKDGEASMKKIGFILHPSAFMI
jgi:hypothetical protein